MKERKYEFVEGDTIEVDGRILHRIRALRDFGIIKKNNLGGYIEKEKNLSHSGNCWVDGNAKVYDDSFVFDNAYVCGNAVVKWAGTAYGNAIIGDDAVIDDYARVYGDASIAGNAKIRGQVCVRDHAVVSGSAKICGDVSIYGLAEIYGNADISGFACICNNVEIGDNAIIKSNSDYCSISGFGSKNRTTTFYKCRGGIIGVKCGCFSGTLNEFREAVKETHKDSRYAKEYLMAADLAELRLKGEK